MAYVHVGAGIHQDLLSFPTRRSSDLPLTNEELVGRAIKGHRDEYMIATKFARGMDDATPGDLDRKSTRLNSSHLGISYAVFCLKKKRPTAGKRSSGATRETTTDFPAA